MSYARFSDGDVYVFASTAAYECCGCILQDRQWIDDPEAVFGGYMRDIEPIIKTSFGSAEEMVAHLMRHRDEGHDVPPGCIERLLDPRDQEEVKAYWAKYAQAEREEPFS